MDYAIPDLYLAANPESKTKLLTGFKAAPFVEPANGLVYLRNRWYDPATGTFLTPDPEGYADSSNLYAAFANDPVNLSDPTGRCAGLDSVPCSMYAEDAFDQLANPLNHPRNLVRSARFAAFELKGAALAIPRLARGVYQLATHLPETAEGLAGLARAAYEDPERMYQMAGNALINADPDKAAEFTGETLFFAGFGAATKTTQGAAVLARTRTALGAVGRETLRPVFRAVGKMPVITARGRRLTRLDKTRRFFVQDMLTHPGVNYSPVGRVLKKAFPRLRLQQHHAVIQKSWYRIGGPNQWYPADRLANAGLRRLGDAGWNLIPIPAVVNNVLGKTSIGTAAFAGGVYGGGTYAAWQTFDSEDDADDDN